MDFPSGRYHRPVISPYSAESLGASQRLHAATGTGSSAAWPAANRAIFIPFTLSGFYRVQRVWWANGTTANNNVDCGIYTVGGTQLGAIGSTAQSGTSVVQSAALSLYLAPGSYYMALLLSGTTGHIFRSAPGTVSLRMMGAAQQAVGATALPAIATLAVVSTAYLPCFGITSRTVI